jgi:hypothetical protein
LFLAGERAVVIAEDAREKLERLSWRTWIASHHIERHPRCCNERGQLLARRPQREDIGSGLIELQCDSPLSVAGSAACGQPKSEGRLRAALTLDAESRQASSS